MPEYDQNASEVLPDGEYKYRVQNAKEKTSQNKNPMIELTLDIENGRQTVTDNLVFVKEAYWKIDAFRISSGEVLSSTGKVSFEAEHCIGREGWCELVVDEFEGRQRNKVHQYLFPKKDAAKGATPGAVPAAHSGPKTYNDLGEPDDIPF